MIDCFDRKINYLRISVTDLCNFRCVYCMPAEGVPLKKHTQILSFEEIVEFTKVAVAKGINKIRLTGGEPLVRRGVVSLVKMIAEIDGVEDFGLTTNGVALSKLAQNLKTAGLHRLNVSLDSMNPDRFREITRGGELTHVLAGIKAADDAGFENTKINCVIQEFPDEPDAKEVAAFAEANGYKIRYIRRMCIKTGKFWSVIGGDGGKCDSCNRMRLSSEGMLYPCLFNDTSFSIRELGYEAALDQALYGKPESGHKSHHNEFYQLGG
jgi:cyclic pyranopterin phosphate synthase